jgi:hypothetical protein
VPRCPRCSEVLKADVTFFGEALPAGTQTLNSKPETRNPKPETRNPKPETRNLECYVMLIGYLVRCGPPGCDEQGCRRCSSIHTRHRLLEYMHVPHTYTRATYRHLPHAFATCATYRHLPHTYTRATYRCHIQTSATCATYRHLPDTYTRACMYLYTYLRVHVHVSACELVNFAHACY